MARGELPLGYTADLSDVLKAVAVARGELPLGYTARCPLPAARWHALWLAGNCRSDTLLMPSIQQPLLLWLAGNCRSDTLEQQEQPTKHLAVARGELPLGYTCGPCVSVRFVAVARGELPLGYTASERHPGSDPAVARGELPLGYTTIE